MGANWVSQRTTTALIVTLLQIRALISVKTTAVTGVEGQTFDFRCEYPSSRQSYAKYFCRVDDKDSQSHLIRTERHDQWEREGRFSLYDNTSGAFFIVRVDELTLKDTGTYWCGVDISYLPDHISVIQLNVTRNHHLYTFHPANITPANPMNQAVDKVHLPLFLTAVMCVAAMPFVCLFTFCLQLAVKNRRSRHRQNREMSSEYETMMPGVRTEPEFRCSCSAPDPPDLSALPQPPSDFCPHLMSKHRESDITLDLGDYVDVDVPGHMCQYQHLDLSRLEEHVYHCLHGNNGPKHGPVKEQIPCYCNY
ncbi:transmembrane domain-containing protein TMIGD3-like [Amphiprion ocellaris]|uniref:transmembrane domain-containing protein TMIGD3-like n=1 Tax=Amphiprion ocellaris TaxID=80972 RepID=UPI00241192A0|nr:transmembrane domain-containing protein TMIGD3-like [Amphiprion ocellaris]